MKKIFLSKNVFILILILVITNFLLNLSCSKQFTASEVEPSTPKSQIRHIILFIGDGMQLEHEIAASQYLYGEPMRLVWHTSSFYRLPCTTWDVTTYNQFAAKHGRPPYSPDSFDPLLGYNPDLGGRWPFPLDQSGEASYFLTRLPLPPDGKRSKLPATDSASAATAVATGYKTDDGNIAWLPGDPQEGRLRTLAELMRERIGASIGVVSTVPFSHATPAAHVSHNRSRSNYAQISEEIIRVTKPEVVIGGGYPGPSGTKQFNFISRALYEDLKNGVIRDYVFVEREPGSDGGQALLQAADTAIASNKKLFGLFGGPGGNFEPPLPVNSPGHPAINRQTTENPLLRDAVIAALKVLSRDPDGFFVMFEQGDIDWANHDNDYPKMIGTVWDLNEAVKAAISYVDRPGDDLDWSNTMLVVTADHANGFMRLKRDKDGKPLLGKGMLPQGKPAQLGRPGEYDLVTYATTEHTNELVMVYVYGKGNGFSYLAKRQGTWYPGTKIIDNTQLFEALAEALKLGT
ncbi:MAG: alkaline phosphatase [Candidatus Aminicenantes bacterium]|nr:alkaline phosphatase [Candidatus Aminicenantes bacterium]